MGQRDGRPASAQLRKLSPVTLPAPRLRDHAALGAAIFAAAAAADYVAGREALHARAILSVLGMGLGVGALGGLAAGVALAAAQRLGRFSAALWVTAGVGLGAWLSVALGAPARLGGRDSALAVAAIAASSALGLALVGAGLATQPRPTRPRGWLASLRPAIRLPLCGLALAGAAGMTWVDRVYEVDGYRAAHLALRWAALGAVHVAALALPPRWPSGGAPLRARALAAAAALLALFPFLALRPRHLHELHAILERPYPGLAVGLLRYAGDPDLDGYSAVLGGGDCDSLDPDVHPGAREIPANGVDDNCLRGDAPAPPAADIRGSGSPDGALRPEPSADIRGSGSPDGALRPEPPPPADGPMSVVLVTIDTIVAARTSLYGAKRRTTPELDRHAFSGAVLERAYTAGGWTSLSISSILRGVYPRRLRWTRVFETKQMKLVRAPEAASETIRLMFALPIEEPRPTLQALLQRRGVRTAAVVDDGQSEFLDPALGTAQGFDQFVDMDTRPPGGDDAATTDAALEVLRGMPEGDPFFLWVHYFGPHSPNTAHAGTPTFGGTQEDGYDHELAYLDHHAARLLAELRKMGAAGRKVAVLLASDHGELFRATSRIHGADLREQLIQVPLVLWAPGVRRGRYAGLASTLDIMPTVLGLTGTPAPPGLDGVDLRRVIGADPALSRRVLLSETWRFNSRGDLNRDYVAAFDGDLKLVWNLLDEKKSLRPQERGGEDGEERIGEVDAPRLRERLETYLEETGALDLHD